MSRPTIEQMSEQISRARSRSLILDVGPHALSADEAREIADKLRDEAERAAVYGEPFVSLSYAEADALLQALRTLAETRERLNQANERIELWQEGCAMNGSCAVSAIMAREERELRRAK